MRRAAVVAALAVAYALGRAATRTETRAIRRQATTDDLTGLANRLGLMQHLERLRAAGRGYGVLLVDLDDFKPINDSFGHRTGDRVLQEIAAGLLALDRPLTARLGGDEFVLVLDEQTDLARAAAMARWVARGKVTVDDIVDIVTDASVGAARAAAGDNPAAVLHAADLAMYVAKRTRKGFHVHEGALPAVPESPAVRVRDARHSQLEMSD